MEEKRFNYILKEWQKEQRKLNVSISGYNSMLPTKIEKIRRQLKAFMEKLKRNAGGAIEFTDWEQSFLFAKEFDIPHTGFIKFLNAVEEIESEKPNLTKKEQKIFFKKKLEEIRIFLQKNKREFDSYFNIQLRQLLWRNDQIKHKMQFFTTFYCYEKLENYLIGRIDELENNNNMAKNSPWSSGLFYILLAVIIFTGLGVLTERVHWSLLPLIIVGGILIIGIVGFLQLRNDKMLKDESFVELVIETYKRLPIIGNLIKRK